MSEKNRTMSKMLVEAKIKLFSKFYYEEFEKLAKLEHILEKYAFDWKFSETDDYIRGYWMTMNSSETYSIENGSSFEATVLVKAPEWRIWGLLERLDFYGENGIDYETDFGLLVE